MSHCNVAVRGLRDMYFYARGASCGSFSQHGEDTFINARFGHKRDGFYVDVGVSHPSPAKQRLPALSEWLVRNDGRADPLT